MCQVFRAAGHCQYLISCIYRMEGFSPRKNVNDNSCTVKMFYSIFWISSATN